MVLADCIVVGAGPAGLGTAAELKRTGLETIVVERGTEVAPSWAGRYDDFRLNTSSWFSYLPGARFPKEIGRWPARDDLVEYYERFAQDRGLRIELETDVELIERVRDEWRLSTSKGAMTARAVVVATGKYRSPRMPDWPGAGKFRGQLLHSADYRNPAPFRGMDVLVVGAGNSGFEIALQLHRGDARSARLSIRNPPHIIHRDFGPLPSDLLAVLGRHLPPRIIDGASRFIRRARIGDLSDKGLAEPNDGLYERLLRTGMIPTIDGRFLEAVRRGELEIVAAVERVAGSEVLLSDGAVLTPDAVVAATGYSRDLDPLVGHLGVLDEEGRPQANGAREAPGAPRLWFVGFSEPLSGNLRELRLDAPKVARAVVRSLAGK